MSSAADVEIWDNATQAFDKGSLQEAISLFQSMGTISSKISFNIGSVYLAQDNIQDALKNFQESVKKDSHSAIGYYMCGLCHYKVSRYPQANGQFEQTLKCMRGNKCVDYKQLGLRFQLYECEVLINQAAIHSKQGDTNKARHLLSVATESKVEKRHDVISEALKNLQAGHPVEPMLPPSKVIFRPPVQAVKNVKKKDYLGQAKVLYTADPKDNTPGFSGLKLVQETRQDVLADIRKPGRRETLRKVLASDSPASRPRPPQKALPKMPQDQRQRAETWAGSKPTKPLPKAPLPEAPKRPNDSPSFRKGWDGQKSVNSAFMERPNSPFGGGKSNSSESPRPPKKPLPTNPNVENPPRLNDTTTFGENNNQIEIQVQLNCSMKIKCDENASLRDLKKIICQQAIPNSFEMLYVDGLGKQKKLTEAALDHILQGSIDNPKIVCLSSATV